MPFDLQSFEAELALGVIPTERLPSIAQDALEAGFEGKHVVRMAILEPVAGWAIDQALPGMVEDLGCHRISHHEAALRLAYRRARRILETNEDPLESLSYFFRLAQVAGHPKELYDLAFVDDSFGLFTDGSMDGNRALVREEVENLLFPELAEPRRTAREAAWKERQEKAGQERASVADLQAGQSLAGRQYKRRFFGTGIFRWVWLVVWSAAIGFLGSWRIALGCFLIASLAMISFSLWAEYSQRREERRPDRDD